MVSKKLSYCKKCIYNAGLGHYLIIDKINKNHMLGFGNVPMAASADNSQVIRAKVNICEGDIISDDMVETVTISKKNLPDGTLTKKELAVGKYASVTISANDVVTSQKVSDNGSIYTLEKGSYLMSVAVKNFADALSGKLQSGDIVKVFFPPIANSSVTNLTLNEAICPLELNYVKVVAVTTADGTDLEMNTPTAKSNDSTKSNIPATVTLLVNERQAQILAGQEANTVHLALAYRGGGDKAKELLEEQQKLIDENPVSETTEQVPTTQEGEIATNENVAETMPSQAVEVTK